MTHEQRLHHELDRVGLRYRRLVLWIGLAVCWLVFAAIALAVLVWTRRAGRTVPGIALILMGFTVTLPLFVRYRARIVYWL